MKTPLLIFAALFIALTASAQDWAPVPAGCRMVYGLTDTVITQVVWIEGQAGDTVRLNRRIWACDYCSGLGENEYEETEDGIVLQTSAYYINQPHTIGSAWLMEDGMIRLLDFREAGRELRMPIIAEVGDSWSWDWHSATLESVEVRDFWGEADSVRVLLLDGRQRVEWSRNHGLVRFPQPRRDNPLRLIGVERENGRQGVTVQNFETVFDFRVGDRLEVEHTNNWVEYSYYKTRTQYTVRSVTKHPDSVVVVWDTRWRRDAMEVPRDPVTGQRDWSKPYEYTGFGIGQAENITKTYHRSDYPWLGIYPSQTALSRLQSGRADSMIAEQRWAGYMVHGLRPKLGRSYVEISSFQLSPGSKDSVIANRYNCGSILQEGMSWIELGEGLGEIRYNEHYMIPPMEHRRLVAWSRGEESYGQFSSESYITSRGGGQSPASQVALYPNPTRDLLHLANLPAGARISIADPLGRVVRQQAAATSIDVSDLPAGLWFLRVEGGNAPQVLRFIKE